MQAKGVYSAVWAVCTGEIGMDYMAFFQMLVLTCTTENTDF